MLSVLFWFSFVFYPIAIPILIKRNRAKNELKYGIPKTNDDTNTMIADNKDKSYKEFNKSDISHDMDITSIKGKNLSYVSYLNKEEIDNKKNYYITISPKNCSKESLSENIPVGKFYAGYLDKNTNKICITEKFGNSIKIPIEEVINEGNNSDNDLFNFLYDLTIAGLFSPSDEYDKSIFEKNSFNYIINEDVSIHEKSMEVYKKLNLT